MYALANNDTANWYDPFGLTIVCNCPDAYFAENGIPEGMFTKSGNVYSAADATTFPRGATVGGILWDMLRSSRVFTAKDLNVDQLKRHVSARIFTVSAATRANWAFGEDSDQVFNARYWSPQLMVVKAGQSPSAAVNDLFSPNAGLYQTGCRNSSALILLKGIVDAFGAQAFDEEVGRATSGEITGAAQERGLWRVDTVTAGGDALTFVDWVPGDRGYIRGRTGRGLAGGEWIIYVGNGNFWGFIDPDEPRVRSYAEWIRTVKRFSDGVAEEQGYRFYPGVGLK